MGRCERVHLRPATFVQPTAVEPEVEAASFGVNPRTAIKLRHDPLVRSLTSVDALTIQLGSP